MRAATVAAATLAGAAESAVGSLEAASRVARANSIGAPMFAPTLALMTLSAAERASGGTGIAYSP